MKTQEELNKDFENPNSGELFGGSYPRLALEPGNVSEELTYVKDTTITLNDPDEDEGKKDINVKVLQEVASGLLCTAPIGAIFNNTFEDAKIKKGDVFRIKRYPDAEKKEGKGKGNKMQVYGIKVYKRA